ncbi:uncharacterized protein LOC113334570 [Papaver somniferum]|uniref:uncharacterized protein LOC113334570 n=1 Tax=Papaver somniferum TaxID=3469 RepID=UPI000E704C4D|nr:uncharacterized protein LOC113334570 [Papaver somniferum]
MIQLGTRLGLFFKGNQEENVDVIMDTMKSHLKNLEVEKDIIKKNTRDWNPSILLLQKTKLQQCNDLLVWQTWGNKFVKWLDAPSEGRSGGILCRWDDSKVLTGNYALNANNTSERKLFWREIEEVRCFWNLSWVIGGDFNEIHFTHERSSGGEYLAGMRRLNRFISQHELFDLPLHGATYTWTKNHFNSIKSRIDRIMVSPEWEQQFPNLLQQALSRPWSDHSPISLSCDGVKTGPGPFRCEYYWFTNSNFINFITSTWMSFNVLGNASFSFCKNLQLLKPKLRELSKLEYGDMDRRLDELENTFTSLYAE